ncbi:NAD(P)-dependent oxidoreductase [Gordonia soli]|nr:NAD(P)-binding domain-containing protein [Gordonia soli]
MTASQTITLIGLGPMGQAMTSALLSDGRSVTVWNRTAARADQVVAAGATLADTPAEAVAAGDVIILSLTDYQAMYDILGDATAGLAGKTLVNLSSDSPERTREAARWATDHGANFVTGGVMVPAPMVGTDLAYIYFSGPGETFEAIRDVLEVLGRARYLGSDPGLAQLMYQAHLDIFLGTLSSLMHATALVGSAGISARDFLVDALPFVGAIPAMVGDGGPEEVGALIDADLHPGHLSTATMMGATADHIVQASEAAGIDTGYPAAVARHYARAIADGHGSANWTAIIEGIRDPQPEGVPA